MTYCLKVLWWGVHGLLKCFIALAKNKPLFTVNRGLFHYGLRLHITLSKYFESALTPRSHQPIVNRHDRRDRLSGHHRHPGDRDHRRDRQIHQRRRDRQIGRGRGDRPYFP